MENDPIFGFQHCDIDANITCLTLPQNCPVCSGDNYNTPLKIPPFRMPSPFAVSLQSPYSIVIKPTHGNFLRDYTNSADLHIGITNSRGSVYHFNGKGMNFDEEGWDQCLAYPVTTGRHLALTSAWDSKLIDFSARDSWQPERYEESSYNCYQFVVDFLVYLNVYSPLDLPCRLNKSELVAKIILPETEKAAKYITLYRKLLQEGVSVQYNTTL